MGFDVAAADAVTGAQIGDQRLGRGHLPRRRGLLVQVADEADADAVLVDLGVLGVAAVHSMFLVHPPLGDFDLAVFAAGAVADHEVVAAAVVAKHLAVLVIDLVVVAGSVRAVVQNDVLPGAVGLAGIEQLIASGSSEVAG